MPEPWKPQWSFPIPCFGKGGHEEDEGRRLEKPVPGIHPLFFLQNRGSDENARVALACDVRGLGNPGTQLEKVPGLY